MSEIDTNLTNEFTKSLSLLYVEDDLIVQKQTNKFLNLLFKSVEVANDGKEAYLKYQDNNFDIVITDINMPNMNGLELSKKIKKLNPQQEIIVTSAYNDSEQLIEFINLHVRQFMLKPVEINNMLLTLYTVAKSIVNAKVIEEYKIQIEKNNQELKEKNEELENVVKILDTKLSQLSIHDKTKYKDTNLKNINKIHLNELKELEYNISGTITIVSLSENIKYNNIKVLRNLFLEYSNILLNYKDYKQLTEQINAFVEVLKNKPDNFIEHIHNTSILLKSFIYVLRIWRYNLENGNVIKAFKLHSSMINDIVTIITIIEGKKMI